MGTKGFVFTTVVTVATATMFVAPAAADTAACGATITSDTTLTTDLTCPASGVTIGEDDVVLDLAGHTITGPSVVGTFGVTASSRSNVIVKNGTIKSFDDAVVLTNADEGKLKGLKIRNTDTSAVTLTGADDFVVDQVSVAKGFGSGFVIEDTTDTVVKRSRAAKYGLEGLRVLGTSLHVFVIDSSFNDNDDGIELVDGDHIQLRRNAVASNDSDGILIDAAPVGTIVIANTANGNGSDGIDINSIDLGTSVRDNVANDNGDLGIEAPPQTDDAGGNQASGNGNKAQCENIACI
jgi:hypothetical protein